MSSEYLADRMLDETRHEIDRADSKASILLAGTGVVVAILAQGYLSEDSLAKLSSCEAFIFLGAAAGLGLGGLFFGMAVYPRTGNPVAGRARYFAEHIQYQTVDELDDAIAEESALGQRATHQLLTLSKIVDSKYKLIRWGQVATAVGLVMAVVVGVIV